MFGLKGAIYFALFILLISFTLATIIYKSYSNNLYKKEEITEIKNEINNLKIRVEKLEEMQRKIKRMSAAYIMHQLKIGAITEESAQQFIDIIFENGIELKE